MSSALVITVTINGEPRELPASSTVSSVLELLQMNPRFLAIEKNRLLIPRGQHAECQLAPGDQLEIVTLVGGG